MQRLILFIFCAICTIASAKGAAKEQVNPEVSEAIRKAAMSAAGSAQDQKPLQDWVDRSPTDVLRVASRTDLALMQVMSNAVASRGAPEVLKLYDAEFGKFHRISLAVWQAVLNHMGNDRAQVLERLMASQRSEAKRLAAAAADAKKDGLAPTLDRIRTLMKDDDATIVVEALRAVDRLGTAKEQAMPMVLEYAKDKRLIVRDAALDILSRARVQNEIFPKLLVEVLKTSDSIEERKATVKYIGRYSQIPEYERVLLDLIDVDHSSPLAIEAIKTLHSGGSSSAAFRDRMKRVVERGEEPVLSLAIDVISNDLAALEILEPVILGRLHDPEPAVQIACLVALSRRDSLSERALTAVIEMPDDQSIQTQRRRIAVLLLHKTDERVKVVFRRMIQTTQDEAMKKLLVRSLEG